MLPLGSSDTPEGGAGRSKSLPIRSCSRWGLHSRKVASALVSSYLTFPPLPSSYCYTHLHRRFWRYLSVALSLESPPLGVTQHPALWSSDFPLLRIISAAIAWLTRKIYINTKINLMQI